MVKKIIAITVVWMLGLGAVGAETILTVEKVRDMAIQYNRQFQSVRKELDRARGEIIAARAGALPDISLDGRYSRNIQVREIFLPDFEGGEGFTKIPISQKNDFDFSLSFTQPLYAGGKVSSAMSIARIYEKYSKEKVNEVESQIIFGAESMFYNAILARSNLEVLNSAYEQLSYNLEVVEKYYGQGMVSEYELLRARVEKLNLEPQRIAAESQLNISRKSLKSYLGLPLEEEIVLVSDLSDTMLVDLPPLDSLIPIALKNRPEIKQAELQKRGYDKAVRIAKGNWLFPSLDFNTTYQVTASSDDFRLNDKEISKTWTASLLLNIPIFDGARTIGEVRKAKVDYYQAVLGEQQKRDDIRLEVEQAHDNLMTAKKALDLQKETIGQAEEGTRIANLRYQSGVGTQLEVLSAQTALTDARTNFARAIYSFRLAKSALRKAVSFDII
ncbi:MAG: TolC family protein [Candidatus Zixiibacteriota bacterium]|nr:MAG: TolC family protein [candidate division Zixibacteria bacterium]